MHISPKTGLRMHCSFPKHGLHSKNLFHRDGLMLYVSCIPMKRYIPFGIISVMLMGVMRVFVLTISCLALNWKNGLLPQELTVKCGVGRKPATMLRYG